MILTQRVYGYSLGGSNDHSFVNLLQSILVKISFKIGQYLTQLWQKLTFWAAV